MFFEYPKLLWLLLVPFLLVFVLHNFVMARLLIYNHKTVLYLTLTLALLVVFQLYECQHRPMDEGAKPQWTAAPAPPHAQDGRPMPQADGTQAMPHPADMHPRPQADGHSTLQGPPPPPHDRDGRHDGNAQYHLAHPLRHVFRCRHGSQWND